MVELADKLQNLLSDYASFEKDGIEGLKTKKATYEDVKWYYTSLGDVFNRRLDNNMLLQRFNSVIKEYFDYKFERNNILK